MKTRYVCALLCLLFGHLPDRANATNRLYFPEDRYFATRLEMSTVDSLRKGETSLQFSFVLYRNFLFSCGYSGYRNVKLTGLSPGLIEDLISTADSLFQDDLAGARWLNRDGKKSPYFPLFIYHADFDTGVSPLLNRGDRPLEVISKPKMLVARGGKAAVEEPVILDGTKLQFVILIGGTSKILEEHTIEKEGTKFISVGKTVKSIAYPSLPKELQEAKVLFRKYQSEILEDFPDLRNEEKYRERHADYFLGLYLLGGMLEFQEKHSFDTREFQRFCLGFLTDELPNASDLWDFSIFENSGRDESRAEEFRRRMITRGREEFLRWLENPESARHAEALRDHLEDSKPKVRALR